MEETLSPYEKKKINFSGGYFTALNVSGELELSAKGIEDIPVETGDQIELGDVPSFVLQNITDSTVIIKYTTGSKAVNKKSQVTKTEITNTLPIPVQFDEAFTIGAVTQQGLWGVSITSMPAVAVSSIPAITVEAMPAVAVNSIPAITVEAMPAVAVSSIPAITVEAMPAVAVNSIPAITVETMPAVAVLSAVTNTHKPRVECLAGQATKLFSVGVRKSNRINIRSDQNNGVSLGGSNAVNDSSGGFLDVGMVDYMDTSGELWAFNNGSSSVFVDVLELV